jgi:hypothetical protein
MASFIADYALDGVLARIAEANRLDICIAEPATYEEATGTKSLGNKAAPQFGAAADRAPNGRQITVAAFTDGEVTGTETATYWALTDTVNSRLLASGPLDDPQVVTDGNVFSLAAFNVGIPDAA